MKKNTFAIVKSNIGGITDDYYFKDYESARDFMADTAEKMGCVTKVIDTVNKKEKTFTYEIHGVTDSHDMFVMTLSTGHFTETAS